jgi:hypothetical protein
MICSARPNPCLRTRCWMPRISMITRKVVNKRRSNNVSEQRGCHSAKRCLAIYAKNEFEVREIRAEDVQTLTDVQTDAFFEPTPIAFLNGFFKSFFRVRTLAHCCLIVSAYVQHSKAHATNSCRSMRHRTCICRNQYAQQYSIAGPRGLEGLGADS